MDVADFPFMATAGLVDSSVLLHAAVFAPLAVGGIALGEVGFRRHGGHAFRGLVLGVLLLSVAILACAATG